jgi:hypothetical protein
MAGRYARCPEVALPLADMHRLQGLVRLHRLATGPRETARLLGMSPKTERRYRRLLAETQLLDGEPDVLPELEVLKAAVRARIPDTLPHQESSVAEWSSEVTAMLERGATPTAIFDRLRLEHDDFQGSLSAIKRLCARLQQSVGVRAEDVAIPVQTAPGEVAQVDFGYVGRLYDPVEGRIRRAWVFVLVLGYSRHMVAASSSTRRFRRGSSCTWRPSRSWAACPRSWFPTTSRPR